MTALPGTGRCSSCKAPIVWGMSPKGAVTPFDAEPSANGRFVLEVVDGRVVARRHEPLFDAPGAKLYGSHFSTCPSATAHSTKTK